MQLFKVVEYTYSFEFCPGTNRGLSGYETFYTPAAKLCCGRGGVTGRRQSQEKILKIEDEKHPPQLGWRNKAVCHKKTSGNACFRTWNLFVICRAFFRYVRTVCGQFA